MKQINGDLHRKKTEKRKELFIFSILSFFSKKTPTS